MKARQDTFLPRILEAILWHPHELGCSLTPPGLNEYISHLFFFPIPIYFCLLGQCHLFNMKKSSQVQTQNRRVGPNQEEKWQKQRSYPLSGEGPKHPGGSTPFHRFEGLSGWGSFWTRDQGSAPPPTPWRKEYREDASNGRFGSGQLGGYKWR